MAPKSMTKTSRKNISENSNDIREGTGQDKGFFPKIYRFITEEWMLIASSVISGIIIFGIVFQGIGLYHSFKEQREIEMERGRVEAELNFWKNRLSQYPGHRDIYFKIATLEYRLGNIDEARLNLEWTIKIDPNFEEARVMREQIES
jgi:tetratricopeptide (TPR) repeat protein